MRQKINENPMTQIAVVGVLLVVVGFLMVTRVMKKEDPPAASTSTATAASTVPVTTTAPSTGAVATDPAATPVAAPVALPATPLGPPLPAGVRDAQSAGKAVVLLLVRQGGVEDGLIRSAVARLESDSGLAVFIVEASNIARYARITQPLGVDRVPALVVVRPPSGSAAAPEASVTYGFHSAESVVQAVRDGLYRGPVVPYSPD